MSYDSDEVCIHNPCATVVNAACLGLNTIRVEYVDSPFAVVSNVVILIDTTGGAVVANMEVQDDCEHATHYFKKIAGANPTTINPPVGELINGAPSYILNTIGEVIQVVRDTSLIIPNWEIISNLGGGGGGILTTKGDVLSHDGTAELRVPVGASGQVLSADPLSASGLKWVAPASSGILTTKGDVLSHNGATELRVPVGASGQILSADPLSASGIKWIAPPTSGIRTYHTITDTVEATDPAWTTVGNFAWSIVRYGGYFGGTFTFYASISGAKTLEVRVINGASTLGSAVGIAASGIVIINLATLPVTNSVMSIQVMRGGGGGANPRLIGGQLEFQV
jgi:hypothetical protein